MKKSGLLQQASLSPLEESVSDLVISKKDYFVPLPDLSQLSTEHTTLGPILLHGRDGPASFATMTRLSVLYALMTCLRVI